MVVFRFTLLFCFLTLAYSQQPATLLSTAVSTAYNSKCTTIYGSTSISPVPTTVTSSKQFPARTISTYAVTTPATNVFLTDTSTSTITSTQYVYTSAAPQAKRRSLQIIHEESAETASKEKKAKRASYPNNVQCAVSAIPGTTYFYTSTAASRTVTRTTTTTSTVAATTTTSAPPNPGFEQQTYWIENKMGSAQGYYPYNDGTCHTGAGCYDFGCVRCYGTLTSQPILGNQGASYTLSFWLKENGASSTAVFRVTWNGAEVFNTDNIAGQPYQTGYIPWTQYSITLQGQASNVLQFIGRNDPSYFYLDDLSLVSN